ncbi:MAG: hypothetical protein O7B35_13590 [Deltaproteobacteria bacterium]|nr:hypothetical protein [Deltaproteobacteria bacterium]
MKPRVPLAWRHVPDAAMVVFFVVPSEESLAPRPGMLDTLEPPRVVRPPLHRREERLDLRVVVRGAEPGVQGLDSGPRKEAAGQPGAHLGAAVGQRSRVQGLGALQDVLVLEPPVPQGPYLRRVQALGQVPGHDLPAHPVQEHIEVEALPGDRSPEVGDVPAPELVRLVRKPGVGARTYRAPDPPDPGVRGIEPLQVPPEGHGRYGAAVVLEHPEGQSPAGEISQVPMGNNHSQKGTLFGEQRVPGPRVPPMPRGPRRLLPALQGPDAEPQGLGGLGLAQTGLLRLGHDPHDRLPRFRGARRPAPPLVEPERSLFLRSVYSTDSSASARSFSRSSRQTRSYSSGVMGGARAVPGANLEPGNGRTLHCLFNGPEILQGQAMPPEDLPHGGIGLPRLQKDAELSLCRQSAPLLPFGHTSPP